MKRLRIAIISAAVILGCISCTEEFDTLHRGEAVTKLVVDALLTTETKAHCVKLSLTSPYDSQDADIQMVSGAKVSLSDGDGTIILKEDGGSGCYYTPADYAGQEGHTYRLVIETDREDVGGKYESVCTMPVCGITADKVDYYKAFDKVWVFAIWGRDLPGILSYHAVDLEVNGIGSPYRYWNFIVGNELFDGNYLIAGEYLMYLTEERHLLNGNRAPEFKSGDLVTLCWYEVNKEFYYYLNDISTETAPHFPLFSPQPANIQGNVSGGALGCFALAQITKIPVLIGDPERTRLQMMMENGMEIPDN